MKIKRLLMIFVLVLTCVLSVGQAYAGEWEQKESNWLYKLNNGLYATNGWQYIDNNWYYFNNNGYMQTGWVKDNDWYYLSPSGEMLSNVWIEGKYYVGSDGAMLVNSMTPDGYFVGSNGEWDGKTSTVTSHVISPSKSFTDAYACNEYYMYLKGSDIDDYSIIRHDDYYEINNVKLWTNKKISADYVESLEIGNTITRYGTTYTLYNIETNSLGLKNYYFIYKDVYDHGEIKGWGFYQSCFNKDFYDEGEAVEYREKVTLYEGTVYLSANCNVELMSEYDLNGSYHVTINDFLNNIPNYNENYFIELDANGVITHVKQIYLSQYY